MTVMKGLLFLTVGIEFATIAIAISIRTTGVAVPTVFAVIGGILTGWGLGGILAGKPVS